MGYLFSQLKLFLQNATSQELKADWEDLRKFNESGIEIDAILGQAITYTPEPQPSPVFTFQDDTPSMHIDNDESISFAA